jgi:hypothetical protein
MIVFGSIKGNGPPGSRSNLFYGHGCTRTRSGCKVRPFCSLTSTVFFGSPNKTVIYRSHSQRNVYFWSLNFHNATGRKYDAVYYPILCRQAASSPVPKKSTPPLGIRPRRFRHSCNEITRPSLWARASSCANSRAASRLS